MMRLHQITTLFDERFLPWEEFVPTAQVTTAHYSRSTGCQQRVTAYLGKPVVGVASADTAVALTMNCLRRCLFAYDTVGVEKSGA
jgi:hypothetical protein